MDFTAGRKKQKDGRRRALLHGSVNRDAVYFFLKNNPNQRFTIKQLSSALSINPNIVRNNAFLLCRYIEQCQWFEGRNNMGQIRHEFMYFLPGEVKELRPPSKGTLRQMLGL